METKPKHEEKPRDKEYLDEKRIDLGQRQTLMYVGCCVAKRKWSTISLLTKFRSRPLAGWARMSVRKCDMLAVVLLWLCQHFTNFFVCNSLFSVYILYLMEDGREASLMIETWKLHWNYIVERTSYKYWNNVPAKKPLDVIRVLLPLTSFVLGWT